MYCSRRITVKFPRAEHSDEQCKKRFYVSKGYGTVRVNGESHSPYVLCCLVEALMYDHRHTVNNVFIEFPGYEKSQTDARLKDHYEKIVASLKRWQSLGANPRVNVHYSHGGTSASIFFRPQHCYQPQN